MPRFWIDFFEFLLKKKKSGSGSFEYLLLHVTRLTQIMGFKEIFSAQKKKPPSKEDLASASASAAAAATTATTTRAKQKKRNERRGRRGRVVEVKKRSRRC